MSQYLRVLEYQSLSSVSQSLKILDLIVSEVPDTKIEFCPSVLNLTFKTKVSENTSNTNIEGLIITLISNMTKNIQFDLLSQLHNSILSLWCGACNWIWHWYRGHTKKYHLSIDKVVRDSHYVYPFTVSRYLCTMLYLRKNLKRNRSTQKK